MADFIIYVQQFPTVVKLHIFFVILWQANERLPDGDQMTSVSWALASSVVALSDRPTFFPRHPLVSNSHLDVWIVIRLPETFVRFTPDTQHNRKVVRTRRSPITT